jgi:hypothetical protein
MRPPTEAALSILGGSGRSLSLARFEKLPKYVPPTFSSSSLHSEERGRLYIAIAQCWLRLAEHSERIQPNEPPAYSIARTRAEANVKKAAAEAASHN